MSVFGWATAIGAAAIQQKPADEHGADAHHHEEAAALKNPVKADAASIAAGKTLFTANCANCHGATGVGDGKMGATMKEKPANLTDATWKHGDSDGEIFTVIKTGIKQAGMRAFSPKLTDKQIWDVVNYVRSIGPAK